MTDNTFKHKIYGPYLDAWKIIKLIQYADKTPDSDAQWQRYKAEVDRLNAQYPDNAFVQNNLIRLLLDAADTIARENQNDKL